MKEFLRLITGLIAMIAIVWWAIAASVWSWRNPKADDSTTITELPSVLLFRKLPEYQP